MDCAIAPQDLFRCQAKQRLPRAQQSRRCAASATPASKSQPKSACPATVSRILRRLGLNRIRDLEPAEPVRRYEREKPGEMIHIDIKKLGRINGIGHRITGDRRGQSNLRARGQGPGWEYVHVCIDDHSRLAFAQVMPNERKRSAISSSRRRLPTMQASGSRLSG
jgi:hypothetical protein